MTPNTSPAASAMWCPPKCPPRSPRPAWIMRCARIRLWAAGASAAPISAGTRRAGLAGLILLETNTQPGMTPTSLAPEQAAHLRITFPDFAPGWWRTRHAIARPRPLPDAPRSGAHRAGLPDAAAVADARVPASLIRVGLPVLASCWRPGCCLFGARAGRAALVGKAMPTCATQCRAAPGIPGQSAGRSMAPSPIWPMRCGRSWR